MADINFTNEYLQKSITEALRKGQMDAAVAYEGRAILNQRLKKMGERIIKLSREMKNAWDRLLGRARVQ